jgi:hypothetical protein
VPAAFLCESFHIRTHTSDPGKAIVFRTACNIQEIRKKYDRIAGLGVIGALRK